MGSSRWYKTSADIAEPLRSWSMLNTVFIPKNKGIELIYREHKKKRVKLIKLHFSEHPCWTEVVSKCSAERFWLCFCGWLQTADGSLCLCSELTGCELSVVQKLLYVPLIVCQKVISKKALFVYFANVQLAVDP